MFFQYNISLGITSASPGAILVKSTFIPPMSCFRFTDHSQEEVRLRALENITNKLNYGIVETIDLACDRPLISKLLQWFLKPGNCKKLECLHLILKICGVRMATTSILST